MMDDSTRRTDQLRDQAVWEARREINLRIVLQNGVLCLHTTIITILLIIQITFGVNPWLVWLEDRRSALTGPSLGRAGAG